MRTPHSTRPSPTQPRSGALLFRAFALPLAVTIPIAIIAASSLLAVSPTSAQQARPASSLVQNDQVLIQHYRIDAELDPATHHLATTTQLTFTAPESLGTIDLRLLPALKITRITDDQENLLKAETAPNGTVRIRPLAPFVSGVSVHWTFVYEGLLTGGQQQGNGAPPGQAASLAAIQEPISYLLAAASWFPTVGDLNRRFTAEIHMRVPRGITVLASGSQGPPHPAQFSNGKPADQFDFKWAQPGSPGTVLVGRFIGPFSPGANSNIRVYLAADHQQSAQAPTLPSSIADTAAAQFEFFRSRFGAPPSSPLNVVEMPHGAVPTAWAPELAAISAAYIGTPAGARLMANTIARQWWGNQISPASPGDAWITDGMARYSELLFLEDQNGAPAMQAELRDIAASALAYDTTPLSAAAQLNPLSTQFQSRTFDKGSLVFHMLRWQLGDSDFNTALRRLLSDFSGKSLSTAEFKHTFQAATTIPLTPFFMQWVDGTGAPHFTNKYAVYRLGNNKGFRIVGELDQDLDLLHMPVELRVDTDGKAEDRRIDVIGTSTHYVIDTLGRPHHIVIDPEHWLLQFTPDIALRVAILRALQRQAEGDPVAALAEYQKALDANPISSLAFYRIAELHFTERNYPASVDALRSALRGDAEPHWVEAWSHIQLGKIFDLTGQRDRAVNEYRLAIQCTDNPPSTANEARQFLLKPYQRPDTP